MRTAGVLVAWLLPLIASSGCGKAQQPRPNVLLITLDTTRADAVGRGKGTPAIEAFLDQATHFADARAVAPLTLPAHVTMLSGLLPAHHGIHDNVVSPLPAGRGFPLLAEELKAAGYRTAAFVSAAVLAARTGIAAGFDEYECPVSQDAHDPGSGQVRCEETAAKAVAWLGKKSDAPFFAWVHFFDPHVPYDPWKGDAKRAGTHPGDSPRELYRGEVRRMDAAVGRVLAAVDPRTIVIVASDHGEGLGDHEPAHGPLCYGSVVDVFLAVRGPGMEPGAVVRGPRGQADLAPTLREWCGLAGKPHDGALLTAAPLPFVFSESLYTWRLFGWGQCFAVTDGRYTLVESGSLVEFFEREGDPGELSPIDPGGIEAYERLDRGLREFRLLGKEHAPAAALQDTGTPYGAARRPVGTYLSRRENKDLPDPKSRFNYWARLDANMSEIHFGFRQRNTGAVHLAIRNLRELAEEDPSNPAPHSYLAHAQERLALLTGMRGWHRNAAASAREAILRGYRVATTLKQLLEQSLLGGDPNDMRAAIELAIEQRIIPDLDCVELCVRLARKLDKAARDRARTYLERSRTYLDGPEERTALEDLAARLAE